MSVPQDDILTTVLGEPPETEMDRIIYLPIEDLQPDTDNPRVQRLVEQYTDALAIADSERLLPAQAVGLYNFANYGGLVANVGVGHGKTLLAMLAPRVIGLPAYDMVYLHPADTRQSLRNEVQKQMGRWDIETKFYAMSYTELSQRGGLQTFASREPKLVVADEAHRLRRTGSARVKRLRRWMRQFPATMFIAMSGTLTNDSIDEFAHLAKWALGERAPVPRSFTGKDAWKRCLDVGDRTSVPRHYHWRRMWPLVRSFGGDNAPNDRERLVEMAYDERKKVVRQAFLNRWKTAPGVVKTVEASVGASIRIQPIVRRDLRRAATDELYEARRDVRNLMRLPDGQEIDTPLQKGDALRQLSVGFYYRWDWPDDEPDREWMYARREWNSVVRHVIRYGPVDLDSPASVRDAVQSGQYTHDESVTGAWETWKEHRHKDPPPKETVWMSEYLLDAIDRLTGMSGAYSDSTILWYHWRATARKLEARGYDVYWPDGGRDPEETDGDGVIALSIHSMREGVNLQQYNRNLFVTPPSSGYFWEQALGRTHRQGQMADTVYAATFAHTPIFQRSIHDAREDARYVQRTQGQKQKLLIADWTKEI